MQVSFSFPTNQHPIQVITPGIGRGGYCLAFCQKRGQLPVALVQSQKNKDILQERVRWILFRCRENGLTGHHFWHCVF
jgi:hypothetical protein